MSNCNLVHGDLISRLVGLRNDAMRRVTEAAGLTRQVAELADQITALRSAATAGLCGASDQDLREFGRLFQLPRDGIVESARRVIDAGCWSNLIQQSGFDRLMDQQARQEFRDSLEGDTPPFELEHVEATVRGLVAGSRQTFIRGVANAFGALDRRFRSHDGFKFGSRIIFTHVFSQWGGLNWHSPTFERLEDVCRVLAVLDGKEPPEGSMVREWLMEGRSSSDVCQTTVETPYFRLKTFKNGNAHLWLTRRDLVKKVNLCLAEFYGEVLGDAVPKGAPPISTALSKDLQFYATPSDVAADVMRRVYSGPRRILEPSAGEGALLEAIRSKFGGWHKDWHCDAYEVHPGRARTAADRLAVDPRISVRVANFLEVEPPAEGKLYDAVVMNPPFAGTHWINHVRHAWDFLGSGGELVAVLPANAEFGASKRHDEFRRWAEEVSRDALRWDHLKIGAFRSSGTNVSTLILRMVRP